jgi:hypothetical protein
MHADPDPKHNGQTPRNGQTRLFSAGDTQIEAAVSSSSEQPAVGIDAEPLLRQLKTTVAALGLEWVEAWDPIIAAARCHSCGETLDGDSSLRVRVGRGTHYAALACGNCGLQIRWLQSPSAVPRRDSNEAERADWMEYFGGALYCAVCGIWEYETRARFEMHHVPRILDGCEPHEGRTMPVCRDCHVVCESLRNHQLNARNVNPRMPSVRAPVGDDRP